MILTALVAVFGWWGWQKAKQVLSVQVVCHLNQTETCPPELVPSFQALANTSLLSINPLTDIMLPSPYQITSWQKKLPNSLILYVVSPQSSLIIRINNELWTINNVGNLQQISTSDNVFITIADPNLSSETIQNWLTPNNIQQLHKLQEASQHWPISDWQLLWTAKDELTVRHLNFPDTLLEPENAAQQASVLPIIWQNWPPSNLNYKNSEIRSLDLRFNLPVVKTKYSETKMLTASISAQLIATTAGELSTNAMASQAAKVEVE